MSPKVDPEDLLDTVAIADLLGLADRRVVLVYKSRYEDFPEPIINLGPRRATLWDRNDIIAWAQKTGRPITQ